MDKTSHIFKKSDDTTVKPKPVSKEFEEVVNAFCPTGPGGGVDPTCSPGSSSGESIKSAAGVVLSKVTSQASIDEVKQRPESDFTWFDGTDSETYLDSEDPESSEMLPMMGSDEVWKDQKGGIWYFRDDDAVGRLRSER